MMHRCLADFLEQLGQAGELARVETPLSAPGELAEVARRMALAGGPAILATSTEPFGYPIVANLLATRRRIALALGAADVPGIVERLAPLLRPPATVALGMGHGSSSGLPSPKIVRGPACQQVVRVGRDVDLLRIGPLRLGLSAVVLSEDPDSRCAAAERCTVATVDASRLVIHWSAEGELARIHYECGRRRQQMPVAVALGGDPAVMLSAVAPWPPGIDTHAATGLLRQKPLEVATARSMELRIPAESDFVLEGFAGYDARDDSLPAAVEVQSVTARAECAAGASPEVAPLCGTPATVTIAVTAQTQRSNPVCPMNFAVPTADEALLAESVMTWLLLPLLQAAVPEVTDVELPESGAGKGCAIVALHKTSARQPRRTACALWSRRPFARLPWLVLVDEDVDVRDPHAVARAVATECRPAVDVIEHASAGNPVFQRDPAAGPPSQWCLDATRKWTDEGRPPRDRNTPETAAAAKLVDARWLEYGLGPRP